MYRIFDILLQGAPRLHQNKSQIFAVSDLQS